MSKEKGKSCKSDKCWEDLTDREGPLWLEYSKQGVNGRHCRQRGREEANGDCLVDHDKDHSHYSKYNRKALK